MNFVVPPFGDNPQTTPNKDLRDRDDYAKQNSNEGAARKGFTGSLVVNGSSRHFVDGIHVSQLDACNDLSLMNMVFANMKNAGLEKKRAAAIEVYINPSETQRSYIMNQKPFTGSLRMYGELEYFEKGVHKPELSGLFHEKLLLYLKYRDHRGPQASRAQMQKPVQGNRPIFTGKLMMWMNNQNTAVHFIDGVHIHLLDKCNSVTDVKAKQGAVARDTLDECFKILKYIYYYDSNKEQAPADFTGMLIDSQNTSPDALRVHFVNGRHVKELDRLIIPKGSDIDTYNHHMGHRFNILNFNELGLSKTAKPGSINQRNYSPEVIEYIRSFGPADLPGKDIQSQARGRSGSSTRQSVGGTPPRQQFVGGAGGPQTGLPVRPKSPGEGGSPGRGRRSLSNGRPTP
jgi:hypothetical protein